MRLIKKIFDKFNDLGILLKLLISFLVISIIPLVILGIIANENLHNTGSNVIQRTEELGTENLKAAQEIGKTSIEDSVKALDNKATEAIELRTVELAARVADFLYERDKDLLFLASLEPDPQKYLRVYRTANRNVVDTDKSDTNDVSMSGYRVARSKNPENSQSWRNSPPIAFKMVAKPLYRELTFVDLNGREKIKIADGIISSNLADIRNKKNTYCRAEDYFSHLQKLKRNEIYVSRVIGAQVKGWIYQTPKGIKVKPGSAYAGHENPRGKKFSGIIRWATPFYNNEGIKTGYVTMALDHTHVMEFTDHVVPTEERFSILSDGGSGNYAFIWDNKGRCISHARDFFICGFNPETGEEVPGWLSQETYDKYKKSGKTLEEFVRALPSYNNFSQKKKPASEQIKKGCISLDCRVLDTAPQCQGWHEGSGNGGSGSFLILWSGLWKLTTYAAIPYYTGPYGQSRRGFGYVTIGANVDDFHKDANITKAKIEKSINEQGKEIASANQKTRGLISKSITQNRRIIFFVLIISCLAAIGVSLLISFSLTGPLRKLTESAVAMSKGHLEQSIKVRSKDEIGQLAKSFNNMAKTISEVDRMKSEFVTIASHELRTPIQAMMLGVSGILEGYSGQIDDEVREDLNLAKIGIERLLRLVEDLLNLSRIESQKIELNLESVAVADIIDRAVAEVSDLAGAHQHIILKKETGPIPEIYVDKDRMIQVLINLLSNSIKYTPDGGKIIVSAARTGKEAVLSVADNGYGVPEWAQKEIFKKFFQADSIMSQKVGGCGLGLTITKGFVEKHGGTIQCISPVPEDSYPDLSLGGERKGAIFIVHLTT
ncbi:MAG: HAMP domain-containing sensor histidine kinase [Smithella sp.]